MTKEKLFWNWFEVNSHKYTALAQITDLDKKEELLNTLLEELHKYCPKLYFQIGGGPNEDHELIVTAEGDKDYFDAAESLVSSAPDINGWQIFALKPPMGVNFVTIYEDITLDPAEAWFLPLDGQTDPNSFGLIIYFPNFSAEQKETFLNGSYQMLDTILGEKSVALDLQYVDVDILPGNPEEMGLIEVADLPKYMKWRTEK